MEHYITNLSGKKYLERLAKNPTVIIPTGACEIYGPQLPIGSDLLVAKKIAEKVAERTSALIAPTLETGESSGLRSFPCTFVMPRSVLEGYLEFLVSALIEDGAKNFVFITGHAGNVETVSYVIKKHLKDGIKACQIDWWRFTQGAHSAKFCDKTGPMAHGHASECGTSVMLYLYPELVDLDEIACVDVVPDLYADIIQYGNFAEKTPTGMLGDATVATAEKGKAIVEACVDRIVEFMEKTF